MSIGYNTEREKLAIPGYGRCVDFIVKHVVNIKEREERNKQAKALVKILENISQNSNKGDEYQNRLWDHLFVISNFELDVDSPYPKPEPTPFIELRHKLEYPKINQDYRYYGNGIKKLIEEVSSWEESEKKEKAKEYVANQMKRKYSMWNTMTSKDETILEHLKELSNGKIDLTDREDFTLDATNNRRPFPVKKKRNNNYSSKNNNQQRYYKKTR
jgi:hypothetical protein